MTFALFSYIPISCPKNLSSYTFSQKGGEGTKDTAINSFKGGLWGACPRRDTLLMGCRSYIRGMVIRGHRDVVGFDERLGSKSG